MKPKILLIDIETAPILAYVWKIWDENIGLKQIKKDWHILSFSAKWFGDPETKVIYMDQRNEKNIEDDSKLLKKVWELLDEADILITQNGDRFDIKKLNARFILNGFPPPSSFRSLDTLKITKKHFSFTSHKLEWMTKLLCTKNKKLTKRKYSGFELWKACLAGNKEAWQEMEKYNKLDVLSLEELYKKLQPWDNSINFDVYHDGENNICTCGSKEFIKKGFHYTDTNKFQRYKCKKCGKQSRDRVGFLTKEKKESLRRPIKK